MGELFEEPHQGPSTAHEGEKKVLERLVHCYYWHGMKRHLQRQLESCCTCYKFHSPSKRISGKLNSFPRNNRGHILTIDVFGGKASQDETPRANRFIVTMIALFTKFGVAAQCLRNLRKLLRIPCSRDGYSSLELAVAYSLIKEQISKHQYCITCALSAD